MTARSKSRPKTVVSRINYVNYPKVRLMEAQRLALKNETYSILSSILAYTIFAFFSWIVSVAVVCSGLSQRCVYQVFVISWLPLPFWISGFPELFARPTDAQNYHSSKQDRNAVKPTVTWSMPQASSQLHDFSFIMPLKSIEFTLNAL